MSVTVPRPEVMSGGRCPLPEPRGEVSAYLVDRLRTSPHDLTDLPNPTDDPLTGEDFALALYLLYELSYQGVQDVDDGWEWQPSLLQFRGRLEHGLLDRVRDEIGELEPPEDIVGFLKRLFEGDGGRSVAGWCEARGRLVHLREQAVLRSAWQLKEADPHTWVIPRLRGVPKAALVEIQADEYGGGVTKEIHAELFALTMERLGLDARYGAYIDHLPAVALSQVSLVSMFGLHRRWRGAAVGHLAVFEMASPPTMASLSAALRRLGFDEWSRLFYDTHVVADAHHQTVAAEKLAAGLVEQDASLARDVAFGALALERVEEIGTDHTLDAWEAGRSALRRPLPDVDHAPGQVIEPTPAEDPRGGSGSAAG